MPAGSHTEVARIPESSVAALATLGLASVTILTPSMPGAEAKLQVILRDIHARWRKLSDADLSAIKSRDELVARVIAKYGHDRHLASDVDELLKGRTI